MIQWRISVFAQKLPQPADAIAADDIVGVYLLVELRHIGHVTADDNGGTGSMLPSNLAHFSDFHPVRDDAGDANDVIASSRHFLRESIERRKIEDGARGRSVDLHRHDAPTAMKHSQRERP